MSQSNRRADVLVFDIGRVLGDLREHPFTECVRNRVTVMLYTGRESATPNQTLLGIAHDQLIDDFIKHAINSFQEVWVMGYDPASNTEQERQWFHLNVNAWQKLWEIVRVGNEYAGSMVGFTRINNLIYLYIPTT